MEILVEYPSPKIIEDSVHSVKEALVEDLYLSEDSSDPDNAFNHNDAPVKNYFHPASAGIGESKAVLNEDLHAGYSKDNDPEVKDKYLFPGTAIVKHESVQDNLPSAIVEETKFIQGNTDLSNANTMKNKLMENNTNLSFETKSIKVIDNLSSNLPKRNKPQLTYDQLLYSLMKGDFKQNPSAASSSSKNEDKLANNACAENALLIPVITFPSEVKVQKSSRNPKCLDSNTLVETELCTKHELSIAEMSSPVSNISNNSCDNEDSNEVPSNQNLLVSEIDSDCDENSLHKEITDRSKSNAAIGSEILSSNHHVLYNSNDESSTDSNIFCKDITVNDRNNITSKDKRDNHNNNIELKSLMNNSPNNLCTVIANKFEDGSVRLGFNLIKSCTVTLDPNNYNVSCTFKDPEGPLQNLKNDKFPATLLSNGLLTIENKNNRRHDDDELSSSSLQELLDINLQSPEALEESNASSNSISSCNQDLADKDSSSKEISEDQITASNENISSSIEMLSDYNSDDYSVFSLENNGPFSTKIEKSSHNSKSKVKKGSKTKSKQKIKEKTKKKPKQEHGKGKPFSEKVKNSKHKKTKSNDASAVDEISSEIVKEALKVVNECRLNIFNECVDSNTDVLSFENNAPLSSPDDKSKSFSKSDSDYFLSITKNTTKDDRKQSSIDQTSKDSLNLEMDDITCIERHFKDPCSVDDPYALFGVALLDENSASHDNDNERTDLHQSDLNELDLFQLDTNAGKNGHCFKNKEDLSHLEFSQLSDRSINHVSPTPQSSDSLKLKLFNESPKYNESNQIPCKESYVSIFDQIKSDFGLFEDDCSQVCESSLMNAAGETNVLNEPNSPLHFENLNQSGSTAILIKNTSDIVSEDEDYSSHSKGFLTDDSIFEHSVESIITDEREGVSTSMNEQNKCDTDEFREDCQQVELNRYPISKANNKPLNHLPAKDLSIQQLLCSKNLPVDEMQTNDIDIETASISTCFSAEDKVSSGVKEPINNGSGTFENILLKHMKERNRKKNSTTRTNFRDLIEKNPDVSCNDILSVLVKDVQSTEENKKSLYMNKQESGKIANSGLGHDVTFTFEDILNTHIEHVKSLEEDNQTNTTLGLESDNTDAKVHELALLNDENVCNSNKVEEISNNIVNGSNLVGSPKERITEQINIEVLPSNNVLSQFSCHSTDSIEQNKKLHVSLNIVYDANNCQPQDDKIPEYSKTTDCHIDATLNQNVRKDKEAIIVLNKKKANHKKKTKKNPIDNHNLEPLHMEATVESLCNNSNEGSSDSNTSSVQSGENVLAESDAIKTTNNETSIRSNNCSVLLKRNELLHKDINTSSKESSDNKITTTNRKLHSNHKQEPLCHNDASTELYDPIYMQPCFVLLERIEIPKQFLDSAKSIQPYPEKDLVRLSSKNTPKVKTIPESFCAINESSNVMEEEVDLTKKGLPLRTTPRKAVKYTSNLTPSTSTTTVVCKKTPSKNCNKRKVAKVNSEIIKKFNLKECIVRLEPVDMSLSWKHSSLSSSFASNTKPYFEINTKQSELKKNNDGSFKGKLPDFVKEDKRNEQKTDSEAPDVIANNPLRNISRANNNSLNINPSCMNSKERTNVFFLNQTSNYGIQTRLSLVSNQITPGSSAVKSISLTSELSTEQKIQSESHEEISIKGSACNKLSNHKQGTITLKRTKCKNRGKSEGPAKKRLCSDLKLEDFLQQFHFTHVNDKNFKDSVSIVTEFLINRENYPNMTALLYTVVKYLSLSEKNTLLMFAESEDRSVLLPPDEDCIVTAFFKIQSDETPHLRGLLKATVHIIQNLLISKKTISIYGLASLCRVATEICKRQEDKSSSLTFCCNLLKSKQEFAPYLIASIVSIWMELFKENAGLSDEEIIFLSSIAYAVKVRTNLTNPDWNSSIKILSKYLNSRPVINVQKTINVMMDTIQVSCCDESWIHCHMLTSAVTLFSMHEDYSWIEENVIKRFVSPLLKKFGMENIHSKAFELFCNLYVDLFLMNPSTNPREELLIKFFKKENIKEDCTYIQESAALALMKYLFLKNIPLPRLLTVWFEKNNNNPKVIAIRTLFTRKSKSWGNKELQEEDFELNVI